MGFSVVEMFLKAHSLSGDLPTLLGFLAGLISILLFERWLPHIHLAIRKKEMSNSKKKAALVAGTISIHNIPEGFAIASAFAQSNPLGFLITLSIALQDIPEGLLVSTPLACYGVERKKSIFFGLFSGFVEAASAIVAFIFLSFVSSVIPFALAFSAGAMAYVVLVELLPDAFNFNRRSAAVFFLSLIHI